MSSSPLSARRSSRARRAPPVFGNTVSSDQLYGRDDEGEPEEMLGNNESQESGRWGGEEGDDDEGEESLGSLEGSLEDEVSQVSGLFFGWR